MYLTNYSESRILQTFLGINLTAPTTMYAALFLSSPGETGTGTEIAYSGYTRMPVTFSEPAIQPGSATMYNTSDIAFATSPISTNNITHLGVMDSLIGGNVWAYMTLDEPIQVTAGVAPLIQAQEWNYMSSGDFSQTYKTRYLNVLRGVSMTGFTPYIALYNGSPDEGGSELVGQNYARFQISFSTPAVQPAGQTMISNTALVSSPSVGDNWGTLTHVVLMNSETAGEAVVIKRHISDMIMGRGNAVFINAGEYTVSMN